MLRIRRPACRNQSWPIFSFDLHHLKIWPIFGLFLCPLIHRCRKSCGFGNSGSGKQLWGIRIQTAQGKVSYTQHESLHPQLQPQQLMHPNATRDDTGWCVVQKQMQGVLAHSGLSFCCFCFISVKCDCSLSKVKLFFFRRILILLVTEERNVSHTSFL